MEKIGRPRRYFTLEDFEKCRERANEASKAWYHRNKKKTKIIAARKKWRKQYYANNRERILKQRLEYYSENRERIRARAKERYKAKKLAKEGRV